jgi:hypothetical protein
LTNTKNAISNNGIFYPVVLIDGQAIGIWKRITKKNEVLVEIKLFQAGNKPTYFTFEKAERTLHHFFAKQICIDFL